jgi:hypothetical protein
MLKIERYTGETLRQHLPELARLRIRVYRDYPYLYEGDMAYEARYLQTYIAARESVAKQDNHGAIAELRTALVEAASGGPPVRIRLSKSYRYRNYGVFTPNSKHRLDVTPVKRGKARARKENADKTPEQRY